MEKEYIAAISAISFSSPFLLSFALNVICQFNIKHLLLLLVIIILITYVLLFKLFNLNQFSKSVSSLIV